MLFIICQKAIIFLYRILQKEKENSKDIVFLVPEKINLKPTYNYMYDPYENRIYTFNKI